MRREPREGERLVRCVRCGVVEVPLDDAEIWVYVRSGRGIDTECPKHVRGAHKWEYAEDVTPA